MDQHNCDIQHMDRFACSLFLGLFCPFSPCDKGLNFVALQYQIHICARSSESTAAECSHMCHCYAPAGLTFIHMCADMLMFFPRVNHIVIESKLI